MWFFLKVSELVLLVYAYKLFLVTYMKVGLYLFNYLTACGDFVKIWPPVESQPAQPSYFYSLDRFYTVWLLIFTLSSRYP